MWAPSCHPALPSPDQRVCGLGLIIRYLRWDVQIKAEQLLINRPVSATAEDIAAACEEWWRTGWPVGLLERLPLCSFWNNSERIVGEADMLHSIKIGKSLAGYLLLTCEGKAISIIELFPAW